MTKVIWMSFDLGVNGDYEGMYAWLDEHSAKECGDSMALVQVPIRNNLVAEVLSSLKKRVKLTSRSRVYIIYRGEDLKNKGVWLVGNRKQAPWAGYGKLKDEATTDET